MCGYGVVVVLLSAAGADESGVGVTAGGFIFVFISSDGGVLVVELAVAPASVELALDTAPPSVDEAVLSVLVLVDPPFDPPVFVVDAVGSVITGPIIAD